MAATIARPNSVQPATDGPSTDGPSITYDVVGKKIWAMVIVSHAEGAENAAVAAPVIALPGPFGEKWAVIWTLKLGPGVAKATFSKEAGIIVPSAQKPSLPLGISILDSQRLPDTVRWQVTFKNEVLAVSQLNCDIAVEWFPPTASSRAGDSPLPRVAPRVVVVHDPTIVVTQDPIG